MEENIAKAIYRFFRLISLAKHNRAANFVILAGGAIRTTAGWGKLEEAILRFISFIT
jgi:hypothetical protein